MTTVTNEHGVASVEAPLGRVDVIVGTVCEVTWVGLDAETVVELALDAPARA